MWSIARILLALTLGCALFHGATDASDKVACPPGHQLVEETVVKEVTRHVCKYVTEMKKVRKTVYECKEEPFCLPKCCTSCSLFGHKPNCGECAKCEPPRMRKVLVKREIVTEVPVCRCVVESVVERVPVRVLRAVPCAAPPQ